MFDIQSDGACFLPSKTKNDATKPTIPLKIIDFKSEVLKK